MNEWEQEIAVDKRNSEVGKMDNNIQYRIKNYIEHWYQQCVQVERLYREFAARFELTSSAMFVLKALWEIKEPCTQKYLCEVLQLPKQTLSNLLQGLEQEEYIIRLRRQEDRRNVMVELTVSGQQLIHKVMKKLKQAEEQAFLLLNTEERETFTRLNEQLTLALEIKLKE